MNDPAEDLTGVWDGVFQYPRNYPATSFTAVLLDLGSSLSGTIHEVGTIGKHKNQALTAFVDGSRNGAAVHFTKTYDSGELAHHQVAYFGQVSGDGCTIQGEWNIPRVWSGAFVMVRPSPAEQDVEEAAVVLDTVEA